MPLPYDEQFFERIDRTALRSAQKVVPHLLRLFAPRSVVDVGCGSGSWLRVLKELGVADVVGIDSSPWAIEHSTLRSDEYIPHNLENELILNRSFDVALCLECAEHLSALRAGGLVRDICRLAPVVVFSAAIPLQLGIGHINEQWPEYWSTLFQLNGFTTADCIRSHIWKDIDIAWWYRQNMICYIDSRFPIGDVVANIPAGSAMSALGLVHPEAYLRSVRRWDLRRVETQLIEGNSWIKAFSNGSRERTDDGA